MFGYFEIFNLVSLSTYKTCNLFLFDQKYFPNSSVVKNGLITFSSSLFQFTALNSSSDKLKIQSPFLKLGHNISAFLSFKKSCGATIHCATSFSVK